MLDTPLDEIRESARARILFFDYADLFPCPASCSGNCRDGRGIICDHGRCIWTYPLGCVTLPEGALDRVLRTIRNYARRHRGERVHISLLGFADRNDRRGSRFSEERAQVNLLYSRARVLGWELALRNHLGGFPFQIHSYWFGSYYHHDIYDFDPGGPNPYRRLIRRARRSLNRRVEIVLSTLEVPWYVEGYRVGFGNVRGGGRQLIGNVGAAYLRGRRVIFSRSNNLEGLRNLEEVLRSWLEIGQ